MKPDISIIILTSRVSKQLKDCIDSIYKFTTSSYEIIIVYISPIDKNADELETFPNSKYLLCPKMDISSGYNKGIADSNADNIIILSSDITVTLNWDTAMLECSQIAPSIGIVGKTKRLSNQHPVKNLEFYISESLNEDCILIKREVVDTIGDFDNRFASNSFIFDDFFLRSRLRGFELFYCGEDYTEKCYDNKLLDNIEYLNIYADDRNTFIDKWKEFLPIKNDLISEILNKLPISGSGNILFLGDNSIVSNTLMRRGYTVNSLSRTTGYSELAREGKVYDMIILFDNITHEQTLMRLLEMGGSILNSKGLIIANIQNSLFIERIHHIFKGNFSIAAFESKLKYPLSCLSRPEIMAAGEVAALELMYLVGFASKPTSEFQRIFKEICNVSPGSSSLREELCIEEYLAVWQKNQYRD